MNNNKLNSTNLKELVTYKELFEIQEKNHFKMDNATFSFLDSIPKDVKSLADVGSGPGFVNRYIPSNIHVIAIDLDDQILKKNKCETRIGDILNLPLENGSVDMAIACDVLEHIDPSKLKQAISEMKRVAGKYIYLQTPNDEILRYSIAYCPNCGNKWHVNFHKTSFNQNTFFSFEDEEWEIIRINYTGEVDNQKDNPDVYKKIEEEKMDIYRVANFTCPRCGWKSCLKNYDKLEQLEKEDNPKWRVKKITPKYSEIGVLFAKKTFFGFLRRLSIIRNRAVYKEKRDYNCIDLKKKQRCNINYSGKEQIPYIIQREIINNSKGFSLKPSTYVTFMFPSLNKTTEVGLDVETENKKPTVTVVLINNNKENIIFEQTINSGIVYFNYKNSDMPLIRVYSSETIVLKKIFLKTPFKRSYIYYTTKKNERSLYKTRKKGILFSYLIPQEGVAFEFGK